MKNIFALSLILAMSSSAFAEDLSFIKEQRQAVVAKFLKQANDPSSELAKELQKRSLDIKFPVTSQNIETMVESAWTTQTPFSVGENTGGYCEATRSEEHASELQSH